jgi:hypothetical protein
VAIYPSDGSVSGWRVILARSGNNRLVAVRAVITFADEARPALFWKIYLAFDEGEYRHENDEPEADPVQTYTHPMVAEIVSEYADIQIK